MLDQLVQVVPTGGQQGELLPYLFNLGEIQRNNLCARRIFCFCKDFPPGGADDGVTVGDISFLIPGRGDANGEHLGVHGTAAEEQLPVGSAGHRVEGGRDDDGLGAGLGHQEEQLGETNIKADAEAQPAELRVKQGDLTPGAQRIRFPEVGAVGDGGVKRWTLRWRAACLPVRSKTKQVLYS